MQGLGGMGSGLNRAASMSGNRASGGVTLAPAIGGFLYAFSSGHNSGFTHFFDPVALDVAAPCSGWADIFLWGPAGYTSGSDVGGKGAALYKRAWLTIGQRIVGSIGNPGYDPGEDWAPLGPPADSYLTLPSGAQLFAGCGLNNFGTGTVHGIATGGDINRDGSSADRGFADYLMSPYTADEGHCIILFGRSK